jgi:hypothetical protein
MATCHMTDHCHLHGDRLVGWLCLEEAVRIHQLCEHDDGVIHFFLDKYNMLVHYIRYLKPEKTCFSHPNFANFLTG